jgi:hypothetical protein
MKILHVGAQLFHADKRKDGYDDANSSFSQFCEGVYTLLFATECMYAFGMVLKINSDGFLNIN